MYTLHTTTQPYLITLHYCVTSMWNQKVKDLKLINLKVVRYLNASGTRSQFSW
jgi:hypothetical protein